MQFFAGAVLLGSFLASPSPACAFSTPPSVTSPLYYLREHSQCANTLATYRRKIQAAGPLCFSPTYPAINWFEVMGAWVHPPFALFSLADLPVDTINSILQKAHDGSSVDQWWLYLASSSYDSTPKRSDDPKTGSSGTRTPLSNAFKSDFLGQSVKDAAHWLKEKPDDVALDSHYFAILDQKAGEGKIVLCRRGDKDLKGDEVTCILYEADQATLELGGIEYGTWEELLEWKGKYEPEVRLSKTRRWLQDCKRTLAQMVQMLHQGLVTLQKFTIGRGRITRDK